MSGAYGRLSLKAAPLQEAGAYVLENFDNVIFTLQQVLESQDSAAIAVR